MSESDEAGAAAVVDDAAQFREGRRSEVARTAADALRQLRVDSAALDVVLEYQGLGPGAGEHLAALLKHRALALPGEAGALCFRSLRLRTNVLGPLGVAALCEGLDLRYLSPPRTHTLIELDLAENSLGAAGVQLLCRALRVYGRLRRLDVSGNACSRGGAAALADLLADETSRARANLKVLHLARNRIFDDGCGALGAAACGRLATLDLRDNDISARGAALLAGAVASSATLTAVDLRGNAISLEGLWALGDAEIDDFSGDGARGGPVGKPGRAELEALVGARYAARARGGVYFHGLCVEAAPRRSQWCGHHVFGSADQLLCPRKCAVS
ncbi:hypothetical protein M885DRAFT_226631 [Pelagophyceae sp. CCMP2097]|nr:hypothetical protein M885DRAFT_226631 [Pelagophyceae sp. CCMP2097]